MLYEGKEREELIKNNGRVQAKPNEIEKDKIIASVEAILDGKADGFIALGEKVPQGDGTTDLQGLMRASNMSKAEIMLAFVRYLDMNALQLLQVIGAMRKMEEGEEED